MSRANNQGMGINYRVSGQGEPLVLIHGWSCEGRYWEEFGYLRQLNDLYTVIVPDLRGHGESDTPDSRDFSERAFASDIISVLDDLHINSAHVFGYSLGGWIAFELAATFPLRIRKAVVGGAHPYAEDLSMLRGLAPSDLTAGWTALGAPLSPSSKQRIASFDPQVLVEMVPDRINKSQRLWNVPTSWLAVCGRNDPRFDAMERFASERRCGFVPVEGLDYLQTWIRSERVLPHVLGFLKGNEATSAHACGIGATEHRLR